MSTRGAFPAGDAELITHPCFHNPRVPRPLADLAAAGQGRETPGGWRGGASRALQRVDSHQ